MSDRKMNTYKEIATELVELEVEIIGKARKEYGDDPRFMMISGKCLDVQWIDEISNLLLNVQDDDVDTIDECIEKLEDYESFSGTSMKKYIDAIKNLQNNPL